MPDTISNSVCREIVLIGYTIIIQVVWWNIHIFLRWCFFRLFHQGKGATNEKAPALYTTPKNFGDSRIACQYNPSAYQSTFLTIVYWKMVFWVHEIISSWKRLYQAFCRNWHSKDTTKAKTHTHTRKRVFVFTWGMVGSKRLANFCLDSSILTIGTAYQKTGSCPVRTSTVFTSSVEHALCPFIYITYCMRTCVVSWMNSNAIDRLHRSPPPPHRHYHHHHGFQIPKSMFSFLQSSLFPPSK